MAHDKHLPTAQDGRGGHPALHAVGRRRERDIAIPWSELVGQTLITGTTRSGKTRALEVLVSGVLHQPGALVVIDPKGDRDLLVRCASEARRQGRRFAVFSLACPEYSVSLNPFSMATEAAEVSARIKALMPSAGGHTTNPFFEEYPLALIERVATLQRALGKPWTLQGLYHDTVFQFYLEQLLCDYLEQQGCHQAKRSAMVAEYRKRFPPNILVDAVNDDLEHNIDHFRAITSNLTPTFRGVVEGPRGAILSAHYARMYNIFGLTPPAPEVPDTGETTQSPLLSSNPAALTWPQIAQEQLVLYIGLSSLLLGDIANRVGRVILQDLIGYLGRRYAYEDLTHATPLTIIVDEFSQVAYPLFANALSMGGGAKAQFILAQQSHADGEAAMGKPAARRVHDNLNTKIWFRLADDATAAEVSEGLGTCSVLLPETAVSVGYGGVGGLTGNSQRRQTARTTPLVRPEWLEALPRGGCFVKIQGALYKVRVPLLTDVSPDERAQLGLEPIWQQWGQTQGEDRC